MKRRKSKDPAAFEKKPGGRMRRASITTLNIDDLIDKPKINKLISDLEHSAKDKYKNLRSEPKEQIKVATKSECQQARQEVLGHADSARQAIKNIKSSANNRSDQKDPWQRSEYFEIQAEIENLQAKAQQEERLIQLAELEEQMRITKENIQYFTNQRIDYEKAQQL